MVMKTELSTEPDAIRAPSGEIAKELTVTEWPRSGSPKASPVVESHMRIVQSYEADTM